MGTDHVLLERINVVCPHLLLRLGGIVDNIA